MMEMAISGVLSSSPAPTYTNEISYETNCRVSVVAVGVGRHCVFPEDLRCTPAQA